MNTESKQILAKYDKNIVALASQLRDLLLANFPGVVEMPDPADNVIGFGYGPGYKDLICTIILSQKGVKLGFYRGAELPDPARILTGSGKVHKYVQVTSAADISNPDLKTLLGAALKAHQGRKA